MNLIHLESLLALVGEGGFREAARATGISQPSLSQHVRKLEETLGVSLLARHHDGCRLTPAGEAFLPYARSMLRTADRARALFTSRSLRVGASSNVGVYMLPSYLRSYRDRHPEDDISLLIDTNPSILDQLDRRELDVAVVEWWDDRPGFLAKPWRREPMVVITAPDHPWAAERSLPARALIGCKLLGGESGTGTGRLLQRVLGPIADSLAVRAQLGSTEAVKRAVQAGLGVSLVMAGTVAAEVAAGTLCAIPIADVAIEKPLYLVHGDRLPAASPAQLFAGHLASG